MSARNLIIGGIALAAIVLLAIFASPSAREWAIGGIVTIVTLLIRGVDHVVRSGETNRPTNGKDGPPISHIIAPLGLVLLVASCGGAQFGGGTVLMEYHDDVVYGLLMASGSSGAVQAMPTVSIAAADEWTSVDVELDVSIKGVLHVGVTAECMFPHSEDDPPECEICVGQMMCFWVPSRDVPVPAKPDPLELVS